MAQMLHRREAQAHGQKVFIAVAAYQGCGAGFTWALFHTGAALASCGIGYELAIYAGHVHVDDSRNRLVAQFLNSDCTDLLFLDADVAWQADDLIRLLSYDRDVVAGVYPKKQGEDAYPVKLPPGEIWADADGLIEAEGVPTGFLRIRRAVIECLTADAVSYSAKNDAPFPIPLIFERQVHDGSRWGGDYVFCRKWRARGGRIYVDPAIRFAHAGEHEWTGSLGQWLKNKAGIGLLAGLTAIAEGRETTDDLLELCRAWDNPFAASVSLLSAAVLMARNAQGPILECGSGLSTLAMAAANPGSVVHALEHSPVFAEHLRAEAERYGIPNIRIHCKPLKERWYDVSDLPATPWGLYVIDGPPRQLGDRARAAMALDLECAPVIADDVTTEFEGPLMKALRDTHVVQVIEADGRAFAIAAPKKRRAAA